MCEVMRHPSMKFYDFNWVAQRKKRRCAELYWKHSTHRQRVKNPRTLQEGKRYKIWLHDVQYSAWECNVLRIVFVSVCTCNKEKTNVVRNSVRARKQQVDWLHCHALPNRISFSFSLRSAQLLCVVCCQHNSIFFLFLLWAFQFGLDNVCFQRISS